MTDLPLSPVTAKTPSKTPQARTAKRGRKENPLWDSIVELFSDHIHPDSKRFVLAARIAMPTC